MLLEAITGIQAVAERNMRDSRYCLKQYIAGIQDIAESNTRDSRCSRKQQGGFKMLLLCICNLIYVLQSTRVRVDHLKIPFKLLRIHKKEFLQFQDWRISQKKLRSKHSICILEYEVSDISTLEKLNTNTNAISFLNGQWAYL